MEANTPQLIVQEDTVKERTGAIGKGRLKLYKVEVDGVDYFTIAENKDEASIYLAAYGDEAQAVDRSALVLPIDCVYLDSPNAHELSASLRELRRATSGLFDTVATNLVQTEDVKNRLAEFKELVISGFHAIEDELVKRANQPRTQEINREK
jgi:hypothetical protein